jgi:uncharacterized protein (DUF952 family)
LAGGAATLPAMTQQDTFRWIYHLSRRADWDRARAAGSYEGSREDTADGFLHFSTALQVTGSAAKHRSGERGLVLLEVDSAALGEALKWEPARGGELFPHLYGPLPVSAVAAEFDLPLGEDGLHVFPAMKAE